MDVLQDNLFQSAESIDRCKNQFAIECFDLVHINDARIGDLKPSMFEVLCKLS